MHTDLKSRRRLLVNASQSYVVADGAWQQGLREAGAFIPDAINHNVWKIGNPGSRIRKLYEARDHALQRLVVAQLKIQSAKKRIQDRQSRTSHATLFLEVHHEL
ncbi:hypothetical protein [Sulfitobacter geojensis]|uniref:hypothetical protein n=1 Tax=Sulfitobacter geojensis TaxID=1342299 RepID=UPI000469FBFB|nr:hypothetical protein [Sulfitobacter geojensis]KHA53128.1 hypothetical protein Z947_3440 [Sulfitobacter geojensis]NYI28213.1 hypothetical protein [Sulfitobacter geojensis]